MFKKGDLVYYRDYPDYLNRDVYDEGYGIFLGLIRNAARLGDGWSSRLMVEGGEIEVFEDDVTIIQPAAGDRLGEARRLASQARADRRAKWCS